MYIKYHLDISFEIENEETHCPIFAQTSVSFKNVKELGIMLIYFRLENYT